MSVTKQEMIDELSEAQEQLFEAIEKLKWYVKITGDTNAKAYLVDHLEIMASREHSFMSSDLNIDDLIQRVQEGQFPDNLVDEDEEDEEEEHAL